MGQLGSQTLSVGTFQKHLLKRTQKKGVRRRILIATLTLTSMVDMFSLLVIFLLQTFSTSPELVMVTKGVTLPAAVTGRELNDAPVLSLTADEGFSIKNWWEKQVRFCRSGTSDGQACESSRSLAKGAPEPEIQRRHQSSSRSQPSEHDGLHIYGTSANADILHRSIGRCIKRWFMRRAAIFAATAVFCWARKFGRAPIRILRTLRAC